MKRAIREVMRKEQNTPISLNANTQSDLQIDKTVPQNQENPKDSNGPCNLGPNEAKGNLNEEEKKHSNNEIK